eukprot:COSAG02_NODE_1339_length_13187_cov_610.871027_2_plen_147_part_00
MRNVRNAKHAKCETCEIHKSNEPDACAPRMRVLAHARGLHAIKSIYITYSVPVPVHHCTGTQSRGEVQRRAAGAAAGSGAAGAAMSLKVCQGCTAFRYGNSVFGLPAGFCSMVGDSEGGWTSGTRGHLRWIGMFWLHSEGLKGCFY